MNLDVESSVFHMSINGCSSIPFSELNTLAMSLADLDNHLENGEYSSTGLSQVNSLVVISEMELKLVVEELESLFRDNAIILNSLQEEPRSIS